MASFALFPWPSHRSDRHPSLQHGCQLVLKTSRAQHTTLVDMIPHGLSIGLTEPRMDQSLRGLPPRRSRGASSQIHHMILDASMPLTARVVTITPPDILAWLTHQTRSNRMQFQRPRAGQHIALDLIDDVNRPSQSVPVRL